ncbi:MAG: hypothetical protein WKF36_09965 [Candidatus Nitrosocosmicus sp.]
MDPLMLLTAAISLINLAILTVLLFVYVRIYKSSKAVFTLGLIFFSIMMVSQNIIAVYAYFAMAQLYSPELYPYILVIHFTELVGLAELLKITWS